MSSRAPGPLAGLRIVELGGVGPGPFAGMLLADLGADVICVEPVGDRSPLVVPALLRNRRCVAVNLKEPAGVDAVLRLIDTADACYEGFRPGAAERLGLGPEECLARNPRLVYGRMTGWGQRGPLAQAPGHDINYIALAGALSAIGPAEHPSVPLNLVGDFGGGGTFLALGLVSAVLHARATGRGQVVDAAMTDGVALLLTAQHGLLSTGEWREGRGRNIVDGGAPFYTTYRCADGGHVALGALEPQFYAALLKVLDLTGDPDFADQHDRLAWPAMRTRLAAIFAMRTRDEWAGTFDGTDACVSPVLSLTEAPGHPHNAARDTFRVDERGAIQASPAPRFSGTPAGEPTAAPAPGAHTRQVFTEAGLSRTRIDELIDNGVLA
jgi:alpha-methylacyl-CoA racemase